MMKNDTFESLVPGPKCSGPKYFRAEVYKWAEVFSGPKLFPGRSCFWAKVYKRAEVFSGPKLFPGQSIYVSGPNYFPGQSCFGPKYFRDEVFRAKVFPGQSECRAKAVSGPNWV